MCVCLTNQDFQNKDPIKRAVKVILVLNFRVSYKLFVQAVTITLIIHAQKLLEKDHIMIETRRLKNIVIFFQTIISFVLSRKIQKK